MHPIHMDNATLVELSGVLSVATPYLASVLTQSRWPRPVNEALTLLVCAIAGTLAFLVAGGAIDGVHDTAKLLAAISAITVGAKVYYLKLGVKCPLMDWIQWHTGDKQAGALPPAAIETPLGIDPPLGPSTDAEGVEGD